MTRVWSMPIDLNDPDDRRVATWLAAQRDPVVAVKKLVLTTAAGQEPPARLMGLVPSLLQEVRALRAEMNQSRAADTSNPASEAVLSELRALRADLARVGTKELSHVPAPPEDPESTQRLDRMFNP
jgi:hypothetical protein